MAGARQSRRPLAHDWALTNDGTPNQKLQEPEGSTAMMTGMLGALMWLMMGLMLVGIATGGVAWAMRRLRGRPSGPLPPADASHETPDETPLEILRRRYAAGELDRDEYLRRSRDLTDTEHGP